MRPLALAVLFLCAACQCGPQQLSSVTDEVTVDPAALAFGEVGVGQSHTLNVNLRNEGQTPVTLHPFVPAGPFSVLLGDLTLEAGATHLVAVTFEPTQAGTFTATLFFSSSLSVALSGSSEGEVTSCVPKTCAQLARACGATTDSCGGPLDCGSCGNGATCDAETGACSCPGTAEICGNGTDDDCDGKVDCADSDCASSPACACQPTGAEVCGNGKDDDCDGKTDCADSDCASTPACTCVPTGAEICGNGLDDDCDGLADCADSDCATSTACVTVACTAGTEVRLTQGTTSGTPDVAWSGTEIAVTWMNQKPNASLPQGDLDFAMVRVDTTGQPIGAPFPVTTDGLMAHGPRLAWSGTDWVIASATVAADLSKNLIQVRHVSAAGAPGSNVLTLGQGWPASVSADPSTGQVGVLWGVTAMNSQPALTLISSAQGVGANNVMTTGGTWDDYGDIVWTGSGWGAVWTQQVNNVIGVYFGRFDAQGLAIGGPTQLDAGQGGYFPRIAWSGQQFGVTFSQGTGVWLRRFDAMGASIGAAMQFATQAGSADIAWTGTVFAIAWEDARAAKPTIWVGELDTMGQSVGQPRQVSCGTGGSSRPAIALAGTQLAVAWDDARNSSNDIYVKLIAP
jgi:hypothetical protein